MDTTNQDSHSSQTTNPASSRRRNGKLAKLFRLSSVILLFSATILVVALLLTLFFSNTNKEDRFVDDTKVQAVFLNGGQVYFGHITSLNSNYLRLNNVYYLRVSQQTQLNQTSTQNNSLSVVNSLVKLGCEFHGPTDQMVINRDQVLFWENLKSDGQVSKNIGSYVKAHPSGPKCDTTSTSPAQSTDTTPAVSPGHN